MAFKRKNKLKLTPLVACDGFPQEILENGGSMKSLDLSGGKTGLGLYFSSVCARLHSNKGQTGRIELGNGGGFGGAVFTLFLP